MYVMLRNENTFKKFTYSEDKMCVLFYTLHYKMKR